MPPILERGGRPEPLREVERELGGSSQTVFLYDTENIGGTEIAELFAREHRDRFPAGVAVASCHSEIRNIVAQIMPHLAGYRPCLIILDDVDRQAWQWMQELLVTLATSRPYASILLVYHKDWRESETTSRVLVGTRLSFIPILRYLQIGYPIGSILDWVKNISYTGTVSSRLGQESANAHALDITLTEVSEELIRRLADEPALLYELDPRKFEELVAELYRRRGCDVKLTPSSGDGGVDVYVVSRDGVGETLWVVQAKRWAAHNKVGAGVVRELIGTVSMANASAGIILTTSFFEPGARAIERELRYRLKLGDYLELHRMLRERRSPG
jgi:hypothetical protein